MKKLGKNKMTAVFVSLAVILFFFAAASIVGFISNDREDGLGDTASLRGLSIIEEVKDENLPPSANINGMTITDLNIGTGEEAVAGKVITVHYTGTLADGTKFDSSIDRGQPFQFILGAGHVIQGWEQGFRGMRVGGKRILVIPPELAYGPNTVGPIPANSTLTFEVELLGVEGQQ